MAVSDTARARLMAILLALVIFAAGVVAGVAIERLWLASGASEEQHSLRERPEVLVARLREQLDLRDDQTEAIARIIARLQDEARTIHENTMTTYRATHERARAEIIELLDSDQAARFQAMYEKLHGRNDRHLQHLQHLRDAGQEPLTHDRHPHAKTKE